MEALSSAPLTVNPNCGPGPFDTAEDLFTATTVLFQSQRGGDHIAGRPPAPQRVPPEQPRHGGTAQAGQAAQPSPSRLQPCRVMEHRASSPERFPHLPRRGSAPLFAPSARAMDVTSRPARLPRRLPRAAGPCRGLCLRRAKLGKASPTPAPPRRALPRAPATEALPAPVEAQAALPGCRSRASPSSRSSQLVALNGSKPLPPCGS